MARAKKISDAQRLTSYAILAALGLIFLWLLVQQSRFNPAVNVALQSPGLAGKSQAGAATAGLIPEAPGFTPLAPAQSYGPETLSDKIDGKAELYLSAGFQEMACRSFTLEKPPGTHLEVFIYDMGNAQNAYAVFSSQRRPGAAAIPLTPNAYTTANAMFFTKGKYYVEMVADRAVESLPGALSAFTTALLAKLPSEAGEAGNATDLFPADGILRDSVRLNAADAFGLGGFDNVYTAEYVLKDGNATAFLAERQTPEQARAEAERFREFLKANGYKDIRPPGAPADLTILGFDDSFEIIMVQGRFVAGVHDATSTAAALDLAARLQQVLKKKP